MTIAEQLRARGLELGLERGLKQGLERGLEQGLERGLKQGVVRGRQQTLEKLLALKFGPLSETVTARIQVAEAEALNRWLERLLTADSAEAVVEL